MINYKIILEYDGSKYNGWQRQGNTDNTIQGRLENLLSRYFSQTIEIHGSGRTDAGVHALGQVANFKIDESLAGEELCLRDTDYLITSINRYLPEDIRITDMQIVDNRFHARLNAKSKTYQYRICLSDKKGVFERKYCASIQNPSLLNIDAMKEASKTLLGEHDFVGFSDSKTKKSTVRRIDSIAFSTKNIAGNTYLMVDFCGNGFLYHTIRLIMGTLIKIGLGEVSPSIINEILASGNRKLVPFLAPAEGLFLINVNYSLV